jgi:hypothetical protein
MYAFTRVQLQGSRWYREQRVDQAGVQAKEANLKLVASLACKQPRLTDSK